MLLSDPPKQTRLKATVNKAFTPRMIEGRRRHIYLFTYRIIWSTKRPLLGIIFLDVNTDLDDKTIYPNATNHLH